MINGLMIRITPSSYGEDDKPSPVEDSKPHSESRVTRRTMATRKKNAENSWKTNATLSLSRHRH